VNTIVEHQHDLSSLRDTFAAAALTGLLSHSIAPEQAMSQYIRIAAAYADAMLREREQTNHDAVPEAIARTESASCGRGCGGTDKPVTLPAVGTGDIPVSRTRGRVGTILAEAEIDALEYVVEEGRIASMDDYGILRSWLIRLRPEWESQSYEESDEKRMNTTMNRDTTPSEGSVQERCTLTDEEREAISLAYSRLTADAKYEEVAATLKAVLERVRK